jgi:flavin-dependent dehydrogenase
MPESKAHGLQLQDGSRVGVIGGGPAGSFFAYFLLQFAQRLGVEIKVDIYEPRDFTVPGPAGCNMCGGIVSESLVQALAMEGIALPSNVVQRSIDSYYLHMDVGDVRIETPLHEMRIAAVHRGGGPRGLLLKEFGGLDQHLLDLAIAEGAHLVRGRVESLVFNGGLPRLRTQTGAESEYDLLCCAVGVNIGAKLLENIPFAYKPPTTTRTYICEFLLGRDVIQREMGSSMHVFLLPMPRLEFAAIIPKGDYVTVCMLGDDIDKDMVKAFLGSREVKQALPAHWQLPADFCHCSPKISVSAAIPAYADRVVFVGDCGSTRLYKDGIGAAYRTSKAAAKAAVFEGISAADFARHYGTVCRRIDRDNAIGRFVFSVSRLLQRYGFARRAIWQMVCKEQRVAGGRRRMSAVLWDTFTGSAPYGDVLLRTFHPAFWGRLLYELVAANRGVYANTSEAWHD